MSNATQTTPFTKDNPLMASMKENRLLNKPGSAKETRHFVIDVSGSGLGYTVGDSLGVFPSNDTACVERLLVALGAGGDELVEVPKVEGVIALREALIHRLSIAAPTCKALEAFHERVTNPAERALLESLLLPEARDKMMEFLGNREFVDLLEEFPSARFPAQEFVGLLRRLMPRLYSIASSPVVFPEEIHLTVAVVRYTTNLRERVGVCSTYLSERLPLHEPMVPVFVASSHFGLPEDESADVIMVGPGTGIAPFRAFIQERAARKSPGRNWLFFGDQHRATDYLYGDEFEAYREEGALDRIDLAFSRDQKEKVYVQDKMLEQGAELWEWVKAGSYLYVCGDAKRMAKDVDAALQSIVALHGEMTAFEAAEYVKAMRKEKRYQRDVY